eukprot:TRINITY_DN9272_c0_g1_i4.p1 TRINITY_DN9272_c0_g1~~TRINITY_DN9272_c0_g1_i4.p1  ORF type:complete len:261 (+),score=66.28 TRINITY_DN9272_c0_g1_i4:150-932(+)
MLRFAVNYLSRGISKRCYNTLTETGKDIIKVYLMQNEKRISPWHDVPIWNDGAATINIVNEIPYKLNQKYAVSKNEQYNPICYNLKKDLQNHTRRKTIKREFTMFNYGMVPQTWYDSAFIDQKMNLCAEDDPLDVCELGEKELEIGEVCRARVLGAFCVLDRNKFDWKIFMLNEVEANAKKIFTAEDYERHNPHKLERIMNWFNKYKMSQFSTSNALLLDSKILSVGETLEVIRAANKTYAELISGKRAAKDSFWLSTSI